MAKNYLIGCVQSRGEFTDKVSGKTIEYDNFILELLTDSEIKSGFRAFEVKIKSSEVLSITGMNLDTIIMCCDDIVSSKNLFSHTVDLLYSVDRSGKARLSHVDIRPVRVAQQIESNKLKG